VSDATQYRIEQELGRGGMAVVYAAYDENLARPVALKVLAGHLADQPEFRARFLREARIAARLAHPNLVRTFDIVDHDGRPCIVMELLPGGTLVDGTLTRDEAAHLARGLAYAHGLGVVHRDLKPANILRASTGTPKIVDFGIASAAEETILTEVGTVLGTLRYLSPEQADGRTVGPPADVFSFAVVLDELLADRTRWDGALLERCRVVDPSGRPTAAELAAALADRTLVAPTRVLARTPTRRPGGRPALLAVGLLVAVVLAAGAVVSSRGGGHTQVEPVPHAASTAQQARELGAWLRRYSR
jgi:serine/threonine protein kinase